MPVTEASIPRIAKESAAIYQKWQPLIERYHGGVPEALIAVRMDIETGGRMTTKTGGGSLLEVGLLSVTKAQETRFGVPDCTRCNAEGNVFLAATRYNVDTALFLKRYPGVAKSLDDAYIFGASLISGIGSGAADYLLDRAPRGITYKQFADWVQMMSLAGRLPTKGPWGSQSLATIVYRVRAFEHMREAAELMQKTYGISNEASTPVVPPRPSWLKSFELPRDAAGALQMLTGGERPFQARPQDLAMFLPRGQRGARGWVPVVAGVAAGAVVGGAALLAAKRWVLS